MLRGLMFGLSLVAGFAVASFAVFADGKKDNAAAFDGNITNWGMPKGFGPGKVTSYWIWFDDGLWHFRTTGGGKGKHHFNGRIDVIGGKFSALKGKKGEYKGKNVDFYRYNAAHNAMVFDFRTDEAVDGVSFALDGGATGLKFTLAIDGQAAPQLIRIGKDGDHPSSAAFTLPAQPPDPPNVKGKRKKK